MIAIVAFILTIGILVIVHEFGHYLFARIFRVKILVFSIGFGPKLFSIKGKYNEWRLSVIPLGGYVQMLDGREAVVDHSQQHFAFDNKKPYQKVLIASAGPLFNILFAILTYYFIALSGINTLKPVISSINPSQFESIADVQLVTPAEILLINNYQPHSWEDANTKFNQLVKHANQINLELKSSANQIQNVVIDANKVRDRFDSDTYFENIGIYPIAYLKTLAYIEPGSVADTIGLKAQDEILQINKVSPSSWFEVANIIQDSPGVELSLIVKRKDKIMHFTVIPNSITDKDGELIGKLGIMPTLDNKALGQNTVIKHYNWIQAIDYAVKETYFITKLNIVSLYQIVTGSLSLHNLGGPITIAKVGATAIHDGFIEFAQFLALVSIGLAIMNLLPIPVLDGGHIIAYLIEMAMDRQISASTYEFITKIGLVIIIGLSLFAIYSDVMRL